MPYASVPARPYRVQIVQSPGDSWLQHKHELFVNGEEKKMRPMFHSSVKYHVLELRFVRCTSYHAIPLVSRDASNHSSRTENSLDHPRDLLRLSKPSQGNHLLDGILVELGRHIALDEAGAHRVDRHASPGELPCHGHGHADDTSLLTCVRRW